MLREGPTEPMIQRSTAISLPGAARAAQTIQAQVDAQETMTTLADQLLVLFDEIPSAGLIRQNRRPLRQHVQTYFRIADGVWEAMAGDQLSELTTNPGYNVVTDTLEQKLVQIHEECQRATNQNPKARGGWLWRRRVRLSSRSLLEWKRCIDTGSSSFPDPTACGRALYRAHGRVGLASVSGFDYLLVTALPILSIVASLLLAFLFGAMNVLLPNNLPESLTPTVLAGLSALYILWFSTTGHAPLPLIVGYALTRRQSLLFTRALRSSVSSSANTSSGPMRAILRVLLTTLGTLFLIALLALLALAVYVAVNFFTAIPTGSAQDASDYMTSLIQSTFGLTLPMAHLFFTILFPISALVIVAVFFLPFTLSVQARLTRGLFGHRSRSPEARRYALRPALSLLTFHTITLFAIITLATIALLTGSSTLVSADSLLPEGWPLVSARLLIYVGALLVPFALLIDLPYREGMARWRSSRLRDLTLRRNDIAQRLSRSQPQATEQADLHTLQDYVTWQYYRTQESEVRHAPTAPFAFGRYLLALILAILGGVALDSITQLLHSLL